MKSGLKLDGATIADIFLGKVKKWNDPEIAKLNPGSACPARTSRSSTARTRRAPPRASPASSPTTRPAWKSGPGVDKDIKWPTGTGAKGNDGVAAAVKQTDGAIGYVEQAYALQNNFTFADVKNKSGTFVAPTLASTSAAGEGLDVPADLRHHDDRRARRRRPTRSRRRRSSITYKDPCKAGASKAEAQGLARLR